MDKPHLEINGFMLIMTCGCCPEQYDVYKDDKQVGYLRLRHGYFYAQYLECLITSHDIVYEANPKGDGVFDDDERLFHLTKAINAIEKRMAETNER